MMARCLVWISAPVPLAVCSGRWMLWRLPHPASPPAASTAAYRPRRQRAGAGLCGKEAVGVCMVIAHVRKVQPMLPK